MSVRCEIDLKGMLDKPQALGKAKDEFAERVMGDFRKEGACGHLVPRRTGSMQDDVAREGDEITWDKDYAVFAWEHNVSGVPHWFEAGAEQQSEEWRRYAAQCIEEAHGK